MNKDEIIVVEGTVYDPSLDSLRKAVKTEEGEFVYIENALVEDQRVRVTIEVLNGESQEVQDAEGNWIDPDDPGERRSL